jgi:GGDEF domain-containing protein
LSALDVDESVSFKAAIVVAEKIRQRLSKPYRLSATADENAPPPVEHRCSSSIGVTLFLGRRLDQLEIIKNADAAMYQAKEAGRNLIRVFGQRETARIPCL